MQTWPRRVHTGLAPKCCLESPLLFSGKRPPRSCPEGLVLHRAMKSTAISKQQKQLLIKDLKGSAATHAKTIRRMQESTAKLVKAKGKAPKTPTQTRVWAKNQRYYQRKKPGQNAEVLTGRPRQGFDLSSTPAPTVVKGIPILPQQVVDFLYSALADFQDFIRLSHTRTPWFLTWGVVVGRISPRGDDSLGQ